MDFLVEDFTVQDSLHKCLLDSNTQAHGHEVFHGFSQLQEIAGFISKGVLFSRHLEANPRFLEGV